MTPSRGTTVIAYVRASTRKQLITGDAQESQVRRREELQAAQDEAERDARDLAGHCDRQGLIVVDVVREVASAGEGKRRPLLDDTLQRLDRGEARALVVTKLDRLSRSIMDFAVIVKRARDNGWSVICLEPAVDMSTPEGDLFAKMLVMFAEYERKVIGGRTRVAMEHVRASGGEGLISVDLEARMLQMADDGMSCNAIARTLQGLGVPTARGGSWSHRTVAPALERARRRRDRA